MDEIRQFPLRKKTLTTITLYLQSTKTLACFPRICIIWLEAIG